VCIVSDHNATDKMRAVRATLAASLCVLGNQSNWTQQKGRPIRMFKCDCGEQTGPLIQSKAPARDSAGAFLCILGPKLINWKTPRHSGTFDMSVKPPCAKFMSRIKRFHFMSLDPS
jgi:hypothetical protein